jgi:uncharacterized membrane protein (UPF0127 family)
MPNTSARTVKVVTGVRAARVVRDGLEGSDNAAPSDGAALRSTVYATRMRELSQLAAVGVALAALMGGCYGAGETLDLDLDELDRIELTVGRLRLNAWLARTPTEHAKGLAVVEADRLEPLADGRLPAMLYVLPSSGATMPAFRLRFQPMDVAVLSRDGIVEALATMPEVPRLSDTSAYVLELVGGNLSRGGVRPGTRLQGLEALPPAAAHSM